MADHDSAEFAKLWNDWRRDLPRRQGALVESIMRAFIEEVRGRGRAAPKYWDAVMLAMARAAMPPLVELEVHAVPNDILEGAHD